MFRVNLSQMTSTLIGFLVYSSDASVAFQLLTQCKEENVDKDTPHVFVKIPF